MLIFEYTSEWEVQFFQLKSVLDDGLKGCAFHIEHVGSTAVPYLDAKPIIDLDIVYYSDAEFSKIKTGLLLMGYYHNGDQGIADREVFKRSGTNYDEILDTIVHHLYVCPGSSIELQKHLLFRNHLRRNEQAREEYASKKHTLAAYADNDKKFYAELKELHLSDYINAIVEVERELSHSK